MIANGDEREGGGGADREREGRRNRPQQRNWKRELGGRSDRKTDRYKRIRHKNLSRCEQVLFVYVSKLIPPCLTDERNFIYCTISNPGTGADDTFVLKCSVWRNATWPSHSQPVIAASARHFQICFSPLTFWLLVCLPTLYLPSPFYAPSHE